MSYQEDRLLEIANAIRAKNGETGQIVANEFASKILQIPVGIDTSDATATAAQILAGYTAYAKGQRLIGTAREFRTASGSVPLSYDGINRTVVTAIPGFFAHSIFFYLPGYTWYASITGESNSNPDVKFWMSNNSAGSNAFPRIIARNDTSFTVYVFSESASLGTLPITWYAIGY